MGTITERADIAPRGTRRRRARRRARRGTGFTAGAVALVVLGFVGGGTVAAGAGATVQTTTNATFGTVLTDDAGMALYTLDTDRNGQSTCHGGCAAAWPPLTVAAGTVATGGPGVPGTVGSSRQANGTFQVTYDGDPLYTFVGDTAPGQVTGNGVAGFSVVVAQAATNPTTTTTTAGGRSGGAAPTAAGAGTSGSGGTSSAGDASTGAVPSPSATTAAGAASVSPRSLAFTGTGPWLRWLSLVGLVLTALGALVAFGPARRRRWRSSRR
jgi:predicted lipoprotein with Yx(FWY)xxD motif